MCVCVCLCVWNTSSSELWCITLPRAILRFIWNTDENKQIRNEVELKAERNKKHSTILGSFLQTKSTRTHKHTRALTQKVQNPSKIVGKNFYI